MQENIGYFYEHNQQTNIISIKISFFLKKKKYKNYD